MQPLRHSTQRNGRRFRSSAAIGTLAVFASIIGLFFALGIAFGHACLDPLGGVGSILVMMLASPTMPSNRNTVKAGS